MDFKIYPLKGSNSVEFGMHVGRVRGFLGGGYEEFRRGKEVFPSDHFEEYGVFCYYDPEGFLEAMEFHEPARVLFEGLDLLSLRFSQVMALLARLDSQFLIDGDGADFRNLSMGIYAPGADDDEEDVSVEAILIARPGYYDVLDSPGS